MRAVIQRVSRASVIVDGVESTTVPVIDKRTKEPVENCEGDPHDLTIYPGGAYTVFHATAGNKVLVAWPSRYCQSDQFESFVAQQFGTLQGGAKILAMADWIESHLDYVPGASNAQTGATDSFISRQGICRDYAWYPLVGLSIAI